MARFAVLKASDVPQNERPNTLHRSNVILLCSPHRKTIKVKILDHEEYDKHANFFIELQEPEWRRRGWTGER